MSDDRQVMTTTQAGEYLNLSHDTVRRLWQKGLIEGYLISLYKGGHLRLYRDSVEEYDRKRKSSPALASP